MLFRSDRKSTRLNSSHTLISYAVFCLKKKKKPTHHLTFRHPVHCVLVTSDIGSTLPIDSSSTNESCMIVVLCVSLSLSVFFFNDTATTEIYPLSLHDALPICTRLNSSHTLISYGRLLEFRRV